MWKTAVRNLLAHKLRLLVTGLSVMLGVAFIAGTLVLTDTITKTFDDLFTDALADTDAMVRARASFEDPNGFADLRGRLDASLVDDVADVEGVAVASGDVWGMAQVVDNDGKPVGNPGAGPPTFGVNCRRASSTPGRSSREAPHEVSATSSSTRALPTTRATPSVTGPPFSCGERRST
jgi:putative ABC transport system permease protein